MARTWDKVLKFIEPAHKTGAKVIVYPYYSIQHDPLSLGENQG